MVPLIGDEVIGRERDEVRTLIGLKAVGREGKG